ncbi:MAG: LemA family protein, partial [Bacteroidota bacterium]
PQGVQVLGEMTRLRDQADAARINGDVRSLGEREQALTAALSGVAVQAEAYPELQAAETFRHAMASLSEVCQALPDRRERYNEAVARHNHRCRQFPTILFAGLFGFPARTPFEIGAAERKKRHDL